jgi:hypothetical protein
MANPEEFTLADETTAWLEVRTTYRYEQQSAYLGTPDLEEDPQPATVQTDGSNQQGTIYACEVTHNNFFTLINPGAYQTETSVAGWPPAQGIIDELIAKLSSTDDRPSYGEIIRRQLQVNALEGFRRTLLNIRQRRVHLLRHSQESFLHEPQAKAELEALLQNVKVGQTADPPPAST